MIRSTAFYRLKTIPIVLATFVVWGFCLIIMVLV